MHELDVDTDRIDEAILALMYLGLHSADRFSGLARSWKSLDWDALKRLHAKAMIFDPINSARSVVLTDEGRQRCEDLFRDLFAKRS
jgi:hypothetical protein